MLELSCMIKKAVSLIWVLLGNRTSDGTPLKREFKSLGSVSLTECTGSLLHLTLDIWPLQAIS